MIRQSIDAVLSRVRTWPKARQDDAVRVLLAMEAQQAGPLVLTEEERSDLDTALREAANEDFASEAEVEAVFARHRA